jgi:hypothetical protein
MCDIPMYKIGQQVAHYAKVDSPANSGMTLDIKYSHVTFINGYGWAFLADNTIFNKHGIQVNHDRYDIKNPKDKGDWLFDHHGLRRLTTDVWMMRNIVWSMQKTRTKIVETATSALREELQVAKKNIEAIRIIIH